MSEIARVVVGITSESSVVDQHPRCWRCGRMLAWFLARPWRLNCSRCKALNASEA